MNAEPVWLTREIVEILHLKSLKTGGGSGGIRDMGLLESALARPLNQFAYGETDIFMLAATYAEALSQNHPFIDGNKRVAFSAADLFLLRNGYDLTPSPGDEHADMIEALAQSKISKDEAAQHLKDYCV